MFDLYLFFLAIDRRMRTGTRSDSKWALRFFIFSFFFFACSSKKMAYQQSRHIIRWRPIRWNPLRRNRRTKSDSGLNFFFFCGCCCFLRLLLTKGFTRSCGGACLDWLCVRSGCSFVFFLSFFLFFLHSSYSFVSFLLLRVCFSFLFFLRMLLGLLVRS